MNSMNTNNFDSFINELKNLYRKHDIVLEIYEHGVRAVRIKDSFSFCSLDMTYEESVNYSVLHIDDNTNLHSCSINNNESKQSIKDLKRNDLNFFKT